MTASMLQKILQLLELLCSKSALKTINQLLEQAFDLLPRLIARQGSVFHSLVNLSCCFAIGLCTSFELLNLFSREFKRSCKSSEKKSEILPEKDDVNVIAEELSKGYLLWGSQRSVDPAKIPIVSLHTKCELNFV